MAVGFIGLGCMGGRMAANLASRVAAGALAPRYDRLLVHDRSAPAMQELAGRHPSVVAATSSLHEVAGQCRTVLLCLPDASVVRSVIDGLLPQLTAGALVIDCSTTGPEAAHAAAAELSRAGFGFLDAPITGAPARAENGTLTAMVGGDPALLEEAKPILGSFSSRVLHVGPEPGSGQLAKAFNNCLYNVSVAAMAEILPLASRAGIELEPLIEAVSSGTGQSYGFQQWAPLVLSREFEAPKHGYPMGSAFKDFETLCRAVNATGVPMPPVLAAAKGTYEAALKMGLQQEHKGAMVKVWECEFGVECASALGGASGEADSKGSDG